MPKLDIDASAREVADLINPRQIQQARGRLDALREGQSLVVQEAFDRMIATNAREQLAALALPGVLPAQDAGETGPMLERLRAATGAPRFPDATETRNLSQAQLHDVYGSNADGWFTATDVNGVQDLNNSFKIHRGSGLNTDSAGCQTIGGGEYGAFTAEVQRNPQQNRWQYVLTSVDAGQQPHQEPAMQNEGQARPPSAPADLPPPPPHPADPGHPDQGLHRQIRDRLGALGSLFNENLEQLSLSLLAEAKSQGLSHIDHLFTSQATPDLKPGEHLFLVQGRPNDPASARAVVNTVAAMATPTEENLIRIDQINHRLSSTAFIDPMQRQPTPDPPGIRLG